MEDEGFVDFYFDKHYTYKGKKMPVAKKKTTSVKKTTIDKTVDLKVVKSVGVKFTSKNSGNYYSTSSTVYTYLVPVHLQEVGIKVGDTVVVDSPYNGLTLVTVKQVSDEDAGTSAIVDWVDTRAYEAEKERVKKIADLKKKMKIARDKVEETAIYKILAKDSKEIAALLAELEELGG